MAISKAKNPRRGAKRRLIDVIGPPTDRRLIVDLLKEMHHMAIDTGAQLGVSAKEQRQSMEMALKDATRSRPSEMTMESNRGVALILNRWRNDSRYRSGDGTPRVLAIKGKGATLQTLVRRCAPETPLREVVSLICENAEVVRLKDDRIALVGSPVMMLQKAPEVTLAGLIMRIRRLTETIVHNSSIPAHVIDNGRFERVVSGELSAREFQVFAQSIRQQLQDLCDRVDERLRPPINSRKRRSQNTCGIGLYVFKDDGNIG
jgi:hypothetical protein